MTYTVRLTAEELWQAASAGVARRVDAIGTRRHQLKHGEKPNHWEYDIQAAIAEFGVCLAFGHRFSGYVPQGISRLADAGPFEVRTIVNDPLAGLAEKHKDPDDQILILTRVKQDRVMLIGWETAEAVRVMGRRNRWDRYELPQRDLRDMSTIGVGMTERVRRYSCLQTG